MTRLFERFDSFAAIEHYKKLLIEEVQNLREQEIKGTTSEHWVAYFQNKFELDVPKIDRANIESELFDTKLDARNFGERYYIRDHSKEVLIDGIELKLYIPYQGNRELFECSGNSLMHSSPKAEIQHNQLVLTYRYTDHNPERINTDTKKDVDYIEGFLKNLTNQFATYNNSIPGIVQQYLNDRIEKLKKDEELKSKLAFPLKARAGAQPTYASPAIRKKIQVERPKANQGQASITPEPTISENDYDEILKICHSMTIVMEKSPHAFSGMGEEDIRQHFLVQLNGKYEGNATGETFNFEGKTDILVKDNNRNVFIGECKFWKGPKTIGETLDQLLGYTSWRDTKTAIFLFNRNKNFSEVLKQIPDLTTNHSNFVKIIEPKINKETEFRFIFHQNNDKARFLTITIMAFDVPGKNHE